MSVLTQFFVSDKRKIFQEQYKDRKGQVEDLKKYSSYQDAVGVDGEPIEFEWKHFPGFSSLSILKETHQDLEKRKIQPEKFTETR